MFKILCQTESQCNLRCLGHSALRYKSPGLTSRKALCNLGPASGLSLQSHLQVPSLLFSLNLGQHKGFNEPFTYWSDFTMQPHDWSENLDTIRLLSLLFDNFQKSDVDNLLLNIFKENFTYINKILIDYSHRCLFLDCSFPQSLFVCLKIKRKKPSVCENWVYINSKAILAKYFIFTLHFPHLSCEPNWHPQEK